MSGIKDAKRNRKRRRRNRRIRLVFYAILLICAAFGLIQGIRVVAPKIGNAVATLAESIKEASEKKAEAKKDSGKDKDLQAEADEKGEEAEPEVEVKALVINTDEPVFSGEPVSLTVSSMGDCTLGTDEGFAHSTSLNAYYEQHGPDYFFQHVRPILEQDDLSIVNMEGTLTGSENRQDKTYAFKAPAEYASILSGSSVEAANLANNHSYDYGEQSYTDTVQALENAGIITFGYEHIKILDIKGVKVGLTGIYELAGHLDKKSQIQENIGALKAAGAQLIIINFHWGIEKEYVPNDIQKELAHYAVDQGADLVIGHHPHVLQGIEKYNGAYIAYSLGNFCFGGNSNPSDTDSMIFQQTFTFQNGERIMDDQIQIIPCSITSSSDKNDYCPVPLEGEEKQRVLDKINEYSQKIQS